MPDRSDPPTATRLWRLDALPGVELSRVQLAGRGFATESHEECSIGLSVRGAERMRVGHRHERVSAGDISLINGGELHGSELAGEEGLVYRAFAIGPAAGAVPSFAVVVARDRPLQQALLDLHRALEGPISALEASSRWQHLLGTLLLRYGGQPAPGPVGRERAAVERARAIVEERLAEELTLEALAREVGLSAYALAHAFQRAYGLPPHAYQTMRRVATAKALLHRVAPAEAAAAVGFYDQSHLNRHFKRYVGLTSGQYRAAMARPA